MTIVKKPDYLIFFVMMVLVFIMAARTPLDSDLWWHLRSGEVTLEEGAPLVRDVFSFTKAGETWINHSWLSQVVLALLYRVGGWLAIGAMMAVLVTASMMLIWPQMRGHAFWRAIVLLLGCLVSAPVWTPRPQLASFFLFSFLLFLLYRYKWKGDDIGPLLPPLFLVWGNLHGGYALGAMLIGCVLLGEGVNHISGKEGAEVVSWHRLKRLAGWSLFAGVVLVINPNGILMWQIPFQTVEVGALQQFIQEWASPDFHSIQLQPFLWLLFAILISVGLSGRRADATDLLTVLVFGYWAFLAQRNVGPFALVGMPVLARYGWIAINKKKDEFEKEGWTGLLRSRRPKWQRRVNLALVGLLAIIGFAKLFITTHPILIDAYSKSGNPAKAVEFIKNNHLEGNMLNEYNWGGYLIWNLPDHPVFVDGRTDLFGDEVIGEWIEVVQGEPGWKEIVQTRDISFMILPPDRPIVNLLAQNGWKQVYGDEIATIFLKSK